jgi:hypothetical protein
VTVLGGGKDSFRPLVFTAMEEPLRERDRNPLGSESLQRAGNSGCLNNVSEEESAISGFCGAELRAAVIL